MKRKRSHTSQWSKESLFLCKIKSRRLSMMEDVVVYLSFTSQNFEFPYISAKIFCLVNDVTNIWSFNQSWFVGTLVTFSSGVAPREGPWNGPAWVKEWMFQQQSEAETNTSRKKQAEHFFKVLIIIEYFLFCEFLLITLHDYFAHSTAFIMCFE